MTFCYILNCYLFATNLVWQCRFINWSVLWNGCFAVFSVTVKVRNCVNFCPDNISDQINLIWWCTIMSQCYAKRVMCFHGQCHSQGSNNQTMIVSTITTKVLILLQTNLVWWCIAISQSVFLTDWIAVPYKIKITAKILNIVCLSAVSFLYRSLFATKVGVLMYYYW